MINDLKSIIQGQYNEISHVSELEFVFMFLGECHVMSGLFNDYLKEISKVSYWIRLDSKPSKLTNGLMGRRLEGQQGSVHMNLCDSS